MGKDETTNKINFCITNIYLPPVVGDISPGHHLKLSATRDGIIDLRKLSADVNVIFDQKWP